VAHLGAVSSERIVQEICSYAETYSRYLAYAGIIVSKCLAFSHYSLAEMLRAMALERRMCMLCSAFYKGCSTSGYLEAHLKTISCVSLTLGAAVNIRA
jgi:hypothetical protein